MSMRGVRGGAVTAALVMVLVGSVVGPAVAFDRPQQVEVDPDSTSLTADLQESGDAEWEIVYRIRFDSDEKRAAFENLSADIEADPTPYTDRMDSRMQAVADDAGNVTGREMAIRNVTVETRNQVDYGLVVYRFEWTNFAAVEGDTITAGDAIDQFYLDDNRSLRLRWPEGYERESVDPSPSRTEGRAVVWEGEQSFDAGQPRVAVVPEGVATNGVGANGTTEAPDDDSAGSPVPLLLGIVLGALVVTAGAWLYVRREGSVGPLGAADDDKERASDTGETGATAEATDDGPPPELLSNEERVLKLLEDNGGRVKQKVVADELDWTAAKTSQVIGDLRDEDRLDSFRLGRENVLTLPDVELEPGEDEE